MSNEAKLIDPSGIPHFIGDLDTLDTDVMLLTADAGQFRASGSDVHTTFQHLSSFYSAPEAEQLFSTTVPVQKKSDAFAGDLEKVAGTLSDYSLEVRPLVKKLDSLKAEATAFVNSVSGDDGWRKDQDKVNHNNDLWHDVNHTVAAFEAAERRAYNKIMALIGGSPLIADDGSHSCNMYGFNAADLDHAKETPWGAPTEREYEGWAWLAHQGKQVWDGFWHDGVVATVHGLGTLVGWDGADAAGQAWTNLAKLSTAAGLTSATMGAWYLIPDKDLPSWLRESRTAQNQAAKGLVAWDEWKTNPGRAAGAFGFNVLTLVGTDGVGAAASDAGKAGAAIRAVSAVGKVGRVVDPMTYVGKAGTFALARVGDAFTTLKNLHTGVTADLLKQADAVRSPKIPADAIPYVDNATGKILYLTDEGHVLNVDGSLRQHVDEAAHELSSDDRQELSGPRLADHSHDLVGAGARAEHTSRSTHVGEQTPAETGSSGGGHVASHEGSSGGTAGAQSFDRPGANGGSGSHGSSGSSHGDGTHDEPHHELTPAERKAIQDEHVRKANEDPEWRKQHYDILGRRKPNVGLVDGVELPQLAKDAHGRFIAKHDLPSGPSEIRLGAKPLARHTAPADVLPTLDKRAADRQAYRDLTNAKRAFDLTPSPENHTTLTDAQKAYAEQLGDVPPNSKISERLGEDASRLHAIPITFRDPKPIPLPKTPNGAHSFDAAYRIENDEILIVEDKAPGNDLDWRLGRADPEDPENPHIGDDGGAEGMRVKQGTTLYLRTIMAEMTKRGGLDAKLAREFRNALKAGKLRYVLVKVQEPNGSLYAGAVVEEVQIY
ncbi:hypothetical protein [Streptomyces sp. AF1A]|uniref:hypothetical protein n=1 Tax=Streptomyces sp. AF1A TaxID=3394350 RepID=UPI0039BC29C1